MTAVPTAVPTAAIMERKYGHRNPAPHNSKIYGALVFDMGSHSLRIGSALDDVPIGDIPTAIAVGLNEDDNSSAAAAASLDPGVKPDNNISYKNAKCYLDVTSLCVPRQDVEIVSCMKDGMIDNWDLFEKLIDYSFGSYLKMEPHVYPILFTEPPLNEKKKREQLFELMFEKYNVPAMFLSKNAVLAGFAGGCHNSTGIIVDSGATHTTVVPINNGFVIPEGIIKCPFGGNFISTQCKKFLKTNRIEIVPQYMIERKCPVNEGETPLWKRKTNLPKVTDSWHDYMCDFIVQDFQKSVLKISESPFTENLISTLATSHFEFPHGYNQEFGIERFKIPESLFDPYAYIGGPTISISNIVATSISKCQTDLKSSLLDNIVVTGGNSLLQGFTERLKKDLSVYTPSTMRLKILASKSSTERRFGAWIGGSIVTNTNTFDHWWISKQEYDEVGKTQIHNRCL